MKAKLNTKYREFNNVKAEITRRNSTQRKPNRPRQKHTEGNRTGMQGCQEQEPGNYNINNKIKHKKMGTWPGTMTLQPNAKENK